MNHHFGTTIFSVVALVSLALAGCAAPEPTASNSAAPPSASPTPTPSVDPASAAPVAVGGLECADVLPTTDAEALDPSLSPEPMFGGSPFLYPRTALVAQLGGLSCVWSNGVPRENDRGLSDALGELAITAIPDAAVEWKKYSEQFDTPVETRGGCPNDGFCGQEMLVDGYWWVQADFYSPSESGTTRELTARFAKTVASISANLTGTDTSIGGWESPASVIDVSDDCGELVSDVEVAAALESDETITSNTFRDGGMYFIGEAIDERAGTTPCTWFAQNEVNDPGAISVVRGGAWTIDALRDAVVDPREVQLDGFDNGDSAFIHCLEFSQTCVLEIFVGGNWVSVQIYGQSPLIESIGIDTFATTIGNDIVGKVRN